MNVGIRIARINGIDKMPYKSKDSDWFWDLEFSKGMLTFAIAKIRVGKNEEKAMENVEGHKESLKDLSIREGSNVALIIDSDSEQVRAISSLGWKNWIDVKDMCIKTFEELNIKITSLDVH